MRPYFVLAFVLADLDGAHAADAAVVGRPLEGPILAPEQTARSGTYLDVIHIAIVCGGRYLLELRFGSIRSRDL